MTGFEAHLEAHKRDDGTYDLAAAEAARADEIASSDDAIESLARKAAKAERTSWEKSNTATLRKQFAADQLTLDLDLDVIVPLGNNVASALGDMDEERIRVREDLRTDHHIKESDAFNAEMIFWRNLRGLLEPGQTLRSAS